MISDELAKEFNQQIQREFESAAYYLGMASYLDHQDWSGFAHFMKIQAEEEREHGMKFYEFLDEVGQRVELSSVEAPPSDYDSVEDVFETALEQERHITDCIHKLLKLARENDDYPAESILEWFVEEQIEEENLMQEHLTRVRRAGDDNAALLMLDQELGEREPE